MFGINLILALAMAASNYLGTVTITGVTPQRAQDIEAAVQKQYGITISSSNKGLVAHNGVELSYSWDGSSVLTINIIKLPLINGVTRYPVVQAEQQLMAGIGAIK